MQLFKYTSLISLLDVLLNQRLYLHPLHLFEDQWEGVPVANEHRALEVFAEKHLPDNDPIRATVPLLAELGRYTLAASCWHQATAESMAMWKIYAGTGQGCCIVADMEPLIASLAGAADVSHFAVTYVKRDSHFHLEVPFPPLDHSARYKDEAYSYEREYRFVKAGNILTKRTMKDDGSLWTEVDVEASTLRAGIYVPFDLAQSKARILLSPFLKTHEHETIRHMVSLASRHAILVDVSRLQLQ